jgi:linoleate 10R-lipoxygenase
LEFPEPTSVNPRRPQASYNLNGIGFHNCPGTTYAQLTIVEIVKAIFSLKNVRRAPGNAGKLKRLTEIINETETDFYIQRNGSVSAWPGSMHIMVGLFYMVFHLCETYPE